MADEIRADYDQLDQVASRFANQSQAIQQMLQKVKSSMDKLEGNWVGLGSEAFFQEMQSLVLPASQRFQNALQEASQVTRRISQTVKTAEEDASSPFRSS